MLSKILKSLKAALRSMMRMIDGTWRAVFGGGGGDIMVDDMVDTDTQMQKSESAPKPGERTEHDERVDRRRDAALVRTYAMRAVMTGERPALAPCLPRSIRDWMPGLTVSDLKMIADANADQVLQHLHRGPYLQGLHRVQRMKPVALKMKTAPVTNDDGPRDVASLRPAFQ